MNFTWEEKPIIKDDIIECLKKFEKDFATPYFNLAEITPSEVIRIKVKNIIDLKERRPFYQF
jgi:hypothetical protein